MASRLINGGLLRATNSLSTRPSTPLFSPRPITDAVCLDMAPHQHLSRSVLRSARPINIPHHPAPPPPILAAEQPAPPSQPGAPNSRTLNDSHSPRSRRRRHRRHLSLSLTDQPPFPGLNSPGIGSLTHHSCPRLPPRRRPLPILVPAPRATPRAFRPLPLPGFGAYPRLPAALTPLAPYPPPPPRPPPAQAQSRGPRQGRHFIATYAHGHTQTPPPLPARPGARAHLPRPPAPRQAAPVGPGTPDRPPHTPEPPGLRHLAPAHP